MPGNDRHVVVVDAMVELAVDVEQLLRALLVEHAHLLEQRPADALAQRLLGQLAAEHGRERMAVRRDDQRHGVDQRAVEVEDDGRVAHPASGSSAASGASASSAKRSKRSGVSEMKPSATAAMSVPGSPSSRSGASP